MCIDVCLCVLRWPQVTKKNWNCSFKNVLITPFLHSRTGRNLFLSNALQECDCLIIRKESKELNLKISKYQNIWLANDFVSYVLKNLVWDGGFFCGFCVDHYKQQWEKMEILLLVVIGGMWWQPNAWQRAHSSVWRLVVVRQQTFIKRGVKCLLIHFTYCFLFLG